MSLIHLYREPGLSEGTIKRKIKELQSITRLVAGLNTEFCFNIEVHGILSESEKEKLRWILASPFNPSKLQNEPFLQGENLGSLLIEIGPRLNVSTPFSSNAVSICHSIGLTKIKRLELSTRYLINWQMNGLKISNALEQQLTDALHDRMTQCCYGETINSFDHGIVPEPWYVVDILDQGRKALEDVNNKLGLAFDNWDLDYYTKLFSEKFKRNPTSVECFDLAQSNSEHSRHWFFKGRLVVDKKEKQESLIDMIISTQKTSNPNNVIKFSDNSSAIEGFRVSTLRPTAVDKASSFCMHSGKYHIVFTAETHNFPTGVAPFSGATTGTGGRIRDVQAVGRGGHCIAGTAGYSVGNLYIPDYLQPWEDINMPYPSNLASPLEILIEASNGASDYGNKFGEPVVSGFTRSFGLSDSSGERREWIKPIMFSGGIGVMNEEFVNKLKPEKGMEVVKVGGPVYRIGVGGGSASSVQVQGDNSSELDFGAVQRGDPEMEQKLNRVIRACMECADGNPICSIHDQGAGGNGNVLKELVEPSGAVIFTNNFTLGDPSVSTLELWGAEYQENDALLCCPEDKFLLKNIAHRERCPINFVGSVTGNGKVILSEDSIPEPSKYIDGSYVHEGRTYPFDLDLELVLGKMPQKVFHLDRKPVILRTFHLPSNLTVMSALERVLRLPTVCSKRFLTNKVDRCVTGLIAQQQCVGPLHTPLSDVAVTAISMFSTEGMATAIGEQPIKGLIDPAAGARMTVGEALSNLVFAKISDVKDVKCSGNWMWAAKLPGEGYALYETCSAMCNIMSELGIALDGGKDSLSMAAKVDAEVVKAPGTLVVSVYAPCPDIRKVVTPDLKAPSTGKCGSLFLIDLSRSNNRLGGSALLQCFSQLGDKSPDMDDRGMFLNAFITTQKLIDEGKILAGHDISDGGLITCLLEMAFGGISGFRVNLEARMRGVANLLKPLFAEELGWILEVRECDTGYVEKCFYDAQVTVLYMGKSQGYGIESKVKVRCSDTVLLDSTLLPLFRMWEETSYRLEKRQANPTCVDQEFESLSKRTGPKYKLTFDINSPPSLSKPISLAPKVAVIREEGTNGDREMAASLYMAHFEVWDVTVQDLLDKKITVDHFKGIVFPGGFSYADVLGSAKGWAASLLFHPELRSQFQAFTSRPDTFSLGVCNGCQLMSLLGWVGTSGLEVDVHTPPDVALDHNSSDRYECRFSTVLIEKSPAIMFKGMEGSVLGVWVAHGEGKFCFGDPTVQSELEKKSCLPLKYVDDNGIPTEEYPMNPNGSPGGIAGICSEDGRHLALMPHPERCTMMWQWPYLPPGWEKHSDSPWLWMFHNAFEWCINN